MRLILYHSEIINSWVVIVYRDHANYRFGRAITQIYDHIRITIPEFAFHDDFNGTKN